MVVCPYCVHCVHWTFLSFTFRLGNEGDCSNGRLSQGFFLFIPNSVSKIVSAISNPRDPILALPDFCINLWKLQYFQSPRIPEADNYVQLAINTVLEKLYWKLSASETRFVPHFEIKMATASKIAGIISLQSNNQIQNKSV